jgi:carbamoyl-phosphate synthase small subunit
MTYPLIGNYGINLDDGQSKSPKVRGFIVKEMCEFPNNFRYEISLNDYLCENKIFGMQDLDTRYLTKNIRDRGVMKGILTKRRITLKKCRKFLRRMIIYVVDKVSTKKPYTVGEGLNIAVMDFGIKQNILNTFVRKGCKMTVFPYTATAQEILAKTPKACFCQRSGRPEGFAAKY